jgi:6,7-dimethyl-8-ribityllumazine synthase
MSILNDNWLKPSEILVPKDSLLVLVKTSWNADITDRLQAGCIRILDQFSLKYRTVEVPGAFEIPFAIRKIWEQAEMGKPVAFIALGCVIKGDTPHFDYVCRAVTDGVLQLNLTLPVPVIFGVLTVDNPRQAEERVGGAHGHKGEEAALSALKLLSALSR